MSPTRDEIMAPSPRPSDDCIVLAMALTGREWHSRATVVEALARLGWHVRPAQVGGWLRRLTGEEMPMIEAAERHPGGLDYRVTRFGHCQLGNRFDGYYVVSHEARVVAAELARERRARA